MEQGLNRWMWDLRRDGVHCIEDVKIFAGFGGAILLVMTRSTGGVDEAPLFGYLIAAAGNATGMGALAWAWRAAVLLAKGKISQAVAAGRI